MALGYQSEVLKAEGCLLPDLVDPLILASLRFAATAAAVSDRISEQGRVELKGRLRDSLKANVGFAPLYLELTVAQQLMDVGFEVDFMDMEGRAQYDLRFRDGASIGEVECKAISADAGRKIHRKDFYRLMDVLAPALADRASDREHGVLLVTLDDRLSPKAVDTQKLADEIGSLLSNSARKNRQFDGFRLALNAYSDVIGDFPPVSQRAAYDACRATFGDGIHVAGMLEADGGVLVVVRSEKEDDPSKPLLKALRQAASQLTGQHPSFIAVQEHGLRSDGLRSAKVRRRAAILSNALFRKYEATHVNAVSISRFPTSEIEEGEVGTPGFAVINPEPKHALSPRDVARFTPLVSDTEPISVVDIEANQAGPAR